MSLNKRLGKSDSNLKMGNVATKSNSIFAPLNSRASLESSENCWDSKNNIILRTE